MSWNKAGFDRGKSLDIEYGTGKPIRALYSNNHEKMRWMATYTKEPDTLWWISQFEKNKVFYDIGANIGLFSFVAAKHGVKVIAFEPESQNFASLQRNIHANPTYDITAYCIGVTNERSFSTLYCSSMGAGSSYHELGVKNKRTTYKQGSYGLSLDEITKSLPVPNYIKIDVDGIERLVIDGYSHWDQLDSFLVEMNDDKDKTYITQKILPLGFKNVSVSNNVIFYKKGFDASFLTVKNYARGTAAQQMYKIINKDGLVAK
jgi:FkbM family methyltransferase